MAGDEPVQEGAQQVHLLDDTVIGSYASSDGLAISKITSYGFRSTTLQ